MEDVKMMPVNLGVEDFQAMYAFTAQHASICPCEKSKLLLPKLRNILDTLARFGGPLAQAENDMFLAIVDEETAKAAQAKAAKASADPGWRH